MTASNPFETIGSQLAEITEKIDSLNAHLVATRPPDANGDRYLTTDEAARILKVSRVTLWSWRKKGILMPVRIGNLLRYKTADIEQMTK